MITGRNNIRIAQNAVCCALIIASTFIAMVMTSGCAWNVNTARQVARITTLGSTGIQAKQRRQNAFQVPIDWLSNATGYGGLMPDERSQQYLRTYALEEDFRADPAKVLIDLRKQIDEQPDLDRLHVLADLAYVQGHRNRLAGEEQYAGRMLATAVSASYEYLFDPQLDHRRNAYDPVFQDARDIYNKSLEGVLRIMKKREVLFPGGSFVASTLDGNPLKVSVSVAGRWRNEEFEQFEFVADYDTKGLRNVHHTYGLGVPLIAIRKSSEANVRPDERYYPKDLSMPITAFVRAMNEENDEAGSKHNGIDFQIQLIDPLEHTQVRVAGRYAPLESDITTPLAYYLDDPLLDANWFATAALLNGEFASQFGGLYMLEPYDPTKIPVVMVHGFWSSPMTWTEMFNDLRADKAIRDNYQFWFYLYPSGQPFWFSARQMREDLAEVRQTLDPQDHSRALQETVLVGHSMGGLVSRMQTTNSGDSFWKLVSDRNINELKGNPDTQRRVRDTLFFNANPSVARVVTLGTPHQGSIVSNSVTRWVSERLFTLPGNLTSEYSQLMKDNPDFFNSDMLKIATSTDSLSPDSSFFDVLLQADTSPKTRFHNIVGIYDSKGATAIFGGSSEASDGVVSVASASCPDATSQIEIPAEHSSIHQHPKAILEVRRILTEHLNDVFARAGNELEGDRHQIVPASYNQELRDPRNPR